jgi:hypothetical protein
MSRLVLSGAILSTSLLMSGCQPPASGEAAGLSYPYLYWQLYKTPLEKNLNVPVQGVSHKQIQDTWGLHVVRDENIKVLISSLNVVHLS